MILTSKSHLPIIIIWKGVWKLLGVQSIIIIAMMNLIWILKVIIKSIETVNK